MAYALHSAFLVFTKLLYIGQHYRDSADAQTLDFHESAASTGVVTCMQEVEVTMEATVGRLARVPPHRPLAPELEVRTLFHD